MATGWSAADVPDLGGLVALVTGGNSGIGLEAARVMAGRGASVVLGCRDTAKGEVAAASIRADHAAARVTVVGLDLADLVTVEQAAATVAVEHPRLDILLNNAGVMATPLRHTADGFELQFGTNHLGHFALTAALLEPLLGTAGARVVNVSSGAHRMGAIAFDNLDASHGYRKWPAYGQSKLANLLFTFELQRRFDGAATTAIAVAAHPGYAATNLQQAGPRMAGSRLGSAAMAVANAVFGQSAQAGALPLLYAATAPDVRGGDYIGPDGIAEARGHPKRVGASAAARDVETAGRLWTVSEELTGVTYAFG